MELCRGMVVRCKAGREKDRWMAVLEVQPEYVLISDGRERPLEAPKRKNPRHLAMTVTVLQPEDCTTNKKLRTALAAYGQRTRHSQGGQELV